MAQEPLTVASLNTWKGRCYRELAYYLARCAADVLCLEEVTYVPTFPPSRRFQGRMVRTDGHPNLFGALGLVLPDYTGCFVLESLRDVWVGGEIHAQRYGSATFVRKTIPVIAARHEVIVGTFGERDKWAPRAAHALKVWRAADSCELVVAHMHGLHIPEGKHDIPARIAQAIRLADLVESLGPAPRVVCGDFNVLPESRMLDMLSGRLCLTNHIREDGVLSTRTPLYERYETGALHADYMLSSPGLDSELIVVKDPVVSDHCPLMLRIH